MSALHRLAILALFVFSSSLIFTQTIAISCATPGAHLTRMNGDTLTGGEIFVKADLKGYRTSHTLVKGPFKSKGDSFEIDALLKFPTAEELNHFFSPGALNFDLDAGDMNINVYTNAKKELDNPDKRELKYSSIDSFEKEFRGTSVKLKELFKKMSLSQENSKDDELFVDYVKSLQLSATVVSMNYTGYTQNYIGKMEVGISWKLTDAYDEVILEEVYVGKSDVMPSGTTYYYMLSSFSERIMDRMEVSFFEDALEQSAYNFFTDQKLKNVLNSRLEKLANVGKQEVIFLKSANKQDNQKDLRPNCVTIKRKDSHGSGCIVSSDGYILTNYHVCGGDQSDTISIDMHDGKSFKASVIRTDPEYDLALLKVDADGLKYMQPERKSNLSIGETVIAIGTPANTFLGQTVTRGVVSGFRESFGKLYIQTDANVSPGNSGGALLTADGKMIGIVSLKSYGMAVEGVGFAIPANVVYERLNIEYK
jgi:S1-C subfamily serine protease